MTIQRSVQFALTFFFACVLLALFLPSFIPNAVIGGAAGVASMCFSDALWTKIYTKFPELPKIKF